MTVRVYQSIRVDALEQFVAEFWNSVEDLKRVAHELEFRTTSRAHRLQHKVRLRIAELPSGSRHEKGRPLSEEDQLFGKVGLHPSAPAFLIKAARKAYRTQYHPDTYSARSAAERKTAEEKFKEFDSLFDEIERMRKQG